MIKTVILNSVNLRQTVLTFVIYAKSSFLAFREQHYLDIKKLFWTILLKEIEENKSLDGSGVDQGDLHKRQFALVAIAMFHSPRFYGKSFKNEIINSVVLGLDYSKTFVDMLRKGQL